MTLPCFPPSTLIVCPCTWLLKFSLARNKMAFATAARGIGSHKAVYDVLVSSVSLGWWKGWKGFQVVRVVMMGIAKDHHLPWPGLLGNTGQGSACILPPIGACQRLRELLHSHGHLATPSLLQLSNLKVARPVPRSARRSLGQHKLGGPLWGWDLV
jgi:hypothetical protein